MLRAIVLALAALSSCATFSAEAANEDKEAEDVQLKEASSKPVPPHLTHGRIYTDAHAFGDLPQLPTDRSPADSSWSNSVAICAVSKMDNTTDLREWVQYNRCVPGHSPWALVVVDWCPHGRDPSVPAGSYRPTSDQTDDLFTAIVYRIVNVGGLV